MPILKMKDCNKMSRLDGPLSRAMALKLRFSDDVRERTDPRRALDMARSAIYRAGNVNLVSSESEDEEAVRGRVIMPVRAPGCRPDLYVARTPLTDAGTSRADQLGLYTRAKLEVGQFIGFYNGHFYDVDYYERLPDAERIPLNEYAISIEDSEGQLVVAPPLTGARPDWRVYPLSMSNEAVEHGVTNAMLVEYSFLLDELDVDPASVDEDRADDEFAACGLVVCRTIGANREITWSYGSGFPRRYTPGRSCRAPHRNRMENPIDVIGRIPRDCVSLDVRD
jgi:hypothetical protein